jgi:CHASE1-domain containing sensor protein
MAIRKQQEKLALKRNLLLFNQHYVIELQEGISFSQNQDESKIFNIFQCLLKRHNTNEISP